MITANLDAMVFEVLRCAMRIAVARAPCPTLCVGPTGDTAKGREQFPRVSANKTPNAPRTRKPRTSCTRPGSRDTRQTWPGTRTGTFKWRGAQLGVVSGVGCVPWRPLFQIRLNSGLSAHTQLARSAKFSTMVRHFPFEAAFVIGGPNAGFDPPSEISRRDARGI